MMVKVFTDGGSRGNPGPAGAGVVITDSSGNLLYQKSKYLGVKTNNEAEYFALITALEWIRDNQEKSNINQIRFHSDSELLVRQLMGHYKVKSKNIRPLFSVTSDLLAQIALPYQFNHIPRRFNHLADQLANQAMDSRHP